MGPKLQGKHNWSHKVARLDLFQFTVHNTRLDIYTISFYFYTKTRLKSKVTDTVRFVLFHLTEEHESPEVNVHKQTCISKVKTSIIV